MQNVQLTLRKVDFSDVYNFDDYGLVAGKVTFGITDKSVLPFLDISSGSETVFHPENFRKQLGIGYIDNKNNILIGKANSDKLIITNSSVQKNIVMGGCSFSTTGNIIGNIIFSSYDDTYSNTLNISRDAMYDIILGCQNKYNCSNLYYSNIIGYDNDIQGSLFNTNILGSQNILKISNSSNSSGINILGSCNKIYFSDEQLAQLHIIGSNITVGRASDINTTNLSAVLIGKDYQFITIGDTASTGLIFNAADAYTKFYFSGYLNGSIINGYGANTITQCSGYSCIINSSESSLVTNNTFRNAILNLQSSTLTSSIREIENSFVSAFDSTLYGSNNECSIIDSILYVNKINSTHLGKIQESLVFVNGSSYGSIGLTANRSFIKTTNLSFNCANSPTVNDSLFFANFCNNQYFENINNSLFFEYNSSVKAISTNQSLLFLGNGCMINGDPGNSGSTKTISTSFIIGQSLTVLRDLNDSVICGSYMQAVSTSRNTVYAFGTNGYGSNIYTLTPTDYFVVSYWGKKLFNIKTNGDLEIKGKNQATTIQDWENEGIEEEDRKQYNLRDLVLVNNKIYISQIDENTADLDDTDAWKEISGGGSSSGDLDWDWRI